MAVFDYVRLDKAAWYDIKRYNQLECFKLGGMSFDNTSCCLLCVAEWLTGLFGRYTVNAARAIIVIMMVLIAISLFFMESAIVATLAWILLVVLKLALLALIFVRFVFVKESTAMAGMRFGAFHRM